MGNDLVRDEAEIGLYFHKLGQGAQLTSPEIFRARVGFEITEGPSVTKVIEHFWQASRAASFISSLNQFAKHDETKDAHKFMVRKLRGVYELFLSHTQEMTPDDLERIMGTHVRMQIVPPPEFMTLWTKVALAQIDELDDFWFKANFDHFTKLGIYPQDEFINAWWARTQGRVEGFEAGEQFRLLYKMATFDFLRTNDFGDIYQDIASPCRRIAEHIFDLVEPQAQHLFQHHINNQVFFAGLWFDKEFVRGIPVAGDQELVASHFERTVAELMGATSIIVDERGLRVPVTGHKIDLKLSYDRTLYGSEVDGISHFNFIAGQQPHENKVIYNASTRFHSWLTSQYLTGVHVMRVPYFFIDPNNTGIPWEKTLRRLAGKEPGVYAYHGSSIVRNMAEKNGFSFPGQTL